MNPEQSTKSLKSRVIDASAWVFGGHVASQLFRLGSNLIMTRLLVPEMFGVMALAHTVMIGLALFSDLGIRQSIIQNDRGEDTVFLNTAWSLQIIRGGFICMIVLVIAAALGWANQFQWLPQESAYAAPVLPYVLALLSFTALIQGFESTKLAMANRKLTLGRITLIELSSQVAGLLLMIGWALLDRSIWALVAGSLLGTLSKTVLSHVILHGQQNRWRWDTASFHELFHFGKWIFLSTMFSYLVGQGQTLLQGALVSVEILGFITIAGVFAWAAGSLVGKLAGSVVFPALSDAARRGGNALPRAIHAFQTRMLLLVVPVFLLLSLFSNELIEFLYDDRYIIVGHYLGIMAINGALGVLPIFYQNAFLASGDSRQHFIISGVSMLLRVAGIMVGFQVSGVDGMLYGIGVGSLLRYVYVAVNVRKHGWLVLRGDIPVLLLVFIAYAYGFLA